MNGLKRMCLWCGRDGTDEEIIEHQKTCGETPTNETLIDTPLGDMVSKLQSETRLKDIRAQVVLYVDGDIPTRNPTWEDVAALYVMLNESLKGNKRWCVAWERVRAKMQDRDKGVDT